MDATIQEDSGDSMQCTQHPFKNNSPTGGICAICLQEKLGKLVSSSFPVAVFPTSSSPSPSFRSDITSSTTTTTTISSASQPPPLPLLTKTHSSNTSSTKCHRQYYSNRSRILYLLSQKKKYKKKDNNNNIIINSNNDLNKNLVFKRSKSTASSGLGLGLGLQHNYMEADNEEELTLTSPHKRGFWSFIHLQKHKQNLRSGNMSSDTFVQVQRSSQEIITMEESTEAFDRKVSRSRSVGCGSRSFSGEFFDRLSTGLGDCALRRVESQRDGHHKRGQDGIKERVKCGGLFSGFMVTSSSSSSSSSSYLVASNANGRVTSSVTSGEYGQQHSRSRSWGWALASPMRAFSKREESKKNQSPNLDAIPSLLSVRS